MDFFLLYGMYPFSVALIVLLSLVLIQIILTVIGMDIVGLADDFLPDFDLDFDAPDASFLEKSLSFLGLGKVPTAIILMSFLGAFGIAGFFFQKIALSMFGTLANPWLASGFAIAISLPVTGKIAALFARIFPSDETSAVSADTLIGRTAKIIYGDATYEKSASAKVTDANNTNHYLQVKALSPDGFYEQGSEVTLVSRKDGFFFVSTE